MLSIFGNNLHQLSFVTPAGYLDVDLAPPLASKPTLNSSLVFYRMLKQASYARWRAETPDGFVFAIKGNRVDTHFRLLKDPAAPIAAQKDNSAVLGDKLRVVLWQLPERLHKDIDRLAGFARALAVWSEVRHAVEFRHDTWFDDETAKLLAEHEIESRRGLHPFAIEIEIRIAMPVE